MSGVLGNGVALRKESVDRNSASAVVNNPFIKVALRKESVDRNGHCVFVLVLCLGVALRKESVDRNVLRFLPLVCLQCRSPQGERG